VINGNVPDVRPAARESGGQGTQDAGDPVRAGVQGQRIGSFGSFGGIG
jgi:hypothetical protein